MHFFIYVGFVIINLEVLEIMIDGVFGSHRIFSKPLGGLYDLLIGSFEVLALLVLTACVVFLARRNIARLKRFSGVEMTEWPKSDANYILIIEILLMSAFLTMNAADHKLQLLNFGHYLKAGQFPGKQSFKWHFAKQYAFARTNRTRLLVVPHRRHTGIFKLSAVFKAFSYPAGFSKYLLFKPAP